MKNIERRLKLGRGKRPRRLRQEPRARSDNRRAEGTADWEFTREDDAASSSDLMNGNHNLPRWAVRRKRSATTPLPAASRVSASGPTTMPNCDFPEAMLNSSFDWNGAREPLHPGDGKRRAQRLGNAVYEAADQPRADVCRRAHLLESRSRQARAPDMSWRALRRKTADSST